MKANHQMSGSRLPHYLRTVTAKYPNMEEPEDGSPGYIHQGTINDRLFERAYTHQKGYNCSECDTSKEIERVPRRSTNPKIHYGVIASGNTLVKNASIRDDIAQIVGDDCICVETEAAGLVDYFPCLVIRGICDYADSHKNDDWQKYASATAAAFGKELLSYVPTRGVEITEPALDVIERMHNDIQELQKDVHDTRHDVKNIHVDHLFRDIRRWLSPADVSTNFNQARELRHPKTGEWLLGHPDFQRWRLSSCGSLWLYGMSGCGKTVLASTILEHLQNAPCKESNILYFFFDFSDGKKQRFGHLLRSLIFQLYSKRIENRSELDFAYTSHDNGVRQIANDTLSACFISMISKAHSVTIILDALDECTEQTALLPWLKRLVLHGFSNLRLLLISKDEVGIRQTLGSFIPAANTVEVSKANVASDINSFIHETLRDPCSELRRRCGGHLALLNDIETALQDQSDGMFRWAACQIKLLGQCLSLEDIRAALKELPSDLDQTYSQVLARIPERHRYKATRLLQVLAYSDEPLSIEAATDAIAVGDGPDDRFEPSSRLLQSKDIITLCPTLINVRERKLHLDAFSCSRTEPGFVDGLSCSLSEPGFSDRSSSSLSESEFSEENSTCTKDVLVDESGSDSSELRLSHFTVKQFLLSPGLQEPFLSSFQPQSARTCLAMACLNYLSSVGDLQTLTSKQDFCAEFPFMPHAILYVMDHVRQCQSSKPVEERVLAFFNHPTAYEVWVCIWSNLTTGCDETERPNSSALSYKLKHISSFILPEPLYYASLLGLDHIARILIDNGADVNKHEGSFGHPLQAATARGHLRVVEILLAVGARINAKGGYHGSALQAAASDGHQLLVDRLMRAGAEVNLFGGAHGTALHAATVNGHLSIVKSLLTSGAHVGARGNRRGQALFLAVRSSRVPIIRMLLGAGADVKNNDGETVSILSEAVKWADREAVEVLVGAGADVNAKDRTIGEYPPNPGTPLMSAVLIGNLSIAEILIAAGADVNAVSTSYGSPLYAANRHGDTHMAHLLIRHGAYDVVAPSQPEELTLMTLSRLPQFSSRSSQSFFRGSSGASDSMPLSRNT